MGKFGSVSVALLLMFFFCKISCFGTNCFYAQFLLSNLQYGAGAVFNGAAWYYNDGNTFQRMRIDYYGNDGSVIQMQLIDYFTRDKYESCGSQCLHQTYLSTAPNFDTSSGFDSQSSCPPSDFTVFTTCDSNCFGFSSSSNQTQICQIGFNSTSPNNLCFVKWRMTPPDTNSNEWHITEFFTSNFPAGSPTDNSTYNHVTNGLNCPQPTCQSKVDAVLVLDESGSITTAHAYPAVQNFALGVINAFNGSYGTDGTRMGLVYFSGLDSCENCSDPGTWKNCSSQGCTTNGLFCSNCGGRWDVAISPPTTNEALLQQTVANHPIQNGYTCLSCGVVQGANVLNTNPRPGVPQVMFFFTDGCQNRETEYLTSVSQAARDQGILIYAVGVASYNYDSLVTITGNASRVYSSASYNDLVNVIPSIVQDFCQPLAPIQSCVSCSGLCACASNCVCPSSCNDNNLCTEDVCGSGPYSPNSNPPQTAGSCLYPSNTSNCVDGNPCTQDFQCNPSSGCFYTPSPRPQGTPPDTFCFSYQCSPKQNGEWVKTINPNACNSSTTACIINYCNTTTNQCETIDRSQIPVGENQYYIDAAGNTQVVSGCGNASGSSSCQNFFCDTTTGNCASSSNCQCLQDNDCNDDNGCTIDTCDLSTNSCNYAPVDCFSIISSSSCQVNSPFKGSTETGVQVWSGIASKYLTQLDLNGIPLGYSVGFPYNCDQLACFNNQPTKYFCSSINSTQFKCNLIATNCSSSGCSDGRCMTFGNWSNGQIVSDCSNYFVPNCNSRDRCKIGYCNISAPSARSPNACFSVSINVTSYCNDNDNCTLDLCDSENTDSLNPCYHYLYDESYLKKHICTAQSVCVNVSCVANTCKYTPLECAASNLCTYFVCNATTNNTCLAVNSTIYKYDQCGVCLGNGYSCVVAGALGNGVSIGVAVGVGVGVSGLFALAAAIFAAKKGYDRYLELSKEMAGNVKDNKAYQGAGNTGENYGLRESSLMNF